MKYVTMRNDATGKETIYLFDKSINHDLMAQTLHVTKIGDSHNWERAFQSPVSAGFVDHTWTCHGRSESLNLNSRDEDTAILASQLS